MWCSGKGGVEVLQHTHDVLALAWAPSGKMLASATLDGQIYLWDPLEAELLVSPAFHLRVPGVSQRNSVPVHCTAPLWTRLSRSRLHCVV